MSTNEERREVAARLRNITDWECDMCFLEEILAACVGDAYVHYSGCQLDYRLMIEGLAELIEPEPERTCSYVEHRDGVYHYYQCSECQCEMAGWDFELYSPNYCMDCDAKIVKVVRDAD